MGHGVKNQYMYTLCDGQTGYLVYLSPLMSFLHIENCNYHQLSSLYCVTEHCKGFLLLGYFKPVFFLNIFYLVRVQIPQEKGWKETPFLS